MFDIKNLLKTHLNQQMKIHLNTRFVALKISLIGGIFTVILLLGHLPLKGAEHGVVFKGTASYKGATVTFLESQKYYPELVKKIRGAKREIEMGMYLFKTTKNRKNYANQLVKELGRAAKRGVNVNILLDQSDFNLGINKANRTTAKKLRRYKNIKLCFDSPKVQSHLKLIVVDKKWTFLGSHNLSFSALKYNHEFSVLVKSKPFAKKASKHLSRLRKSYCSKRIKN